MKGFVFLLLSSFLLPTFISLPFLHDYFHFTAKNCETGSVMNVLEAGLAVFSLPPSSLHWCLSGSDHLTQVFHIMPVPSPLSPRFSPFPLVHPGSFSCLPNDVFDVISRFQNKTNANTGRRIKIPNVYLPDKDALDNDSSSEDTWEALKQSYTALKSTVQSELCLNWLHMLHQSISNSMRAYFCPRRP